MRLHFFLSSRRAQFARTLLAAPLLAVLCTPAVHASTIISYGLSTVGMSGGQTLYRYTYTFSGITFSMNEELDIEFNPALYGQIQNGVAPSGFSLLLFQPNDPPGAPGEYSLLATVNNPSLAGAFSVDFTWNGTGLPGVQDYFLYNDDPVPPVLLSSGQTVAALIGTPEPRTWMMLAAGLALLVTRETARRRHRRKVFSQTA